ncbi:chromatin target of PRMT1 protein-like [Dendronephthya gigantea]|uniref:chromatin target of PRMT1 protein-like n=1 Tax=Dendronephthya gigantea TaxID=151771 RepID=UPI00106C0B88|nr:chromatin target of PRMT1 protein-like [Dendronephthya gigantea]XP_028399452.1 chromatin target of PRMT1 protein-like [Dendronephthya gigantea]
MNVAVPGKIVLKSSTSKTLSDRFGEIAKSSVVENVRNKQRAENVASQKNRRLAAQMTKRMGIEEQSSAKGTVKSRLTIPIANRLGTKRGGQVRGRGGVKVRGQRGGVRGVGSRGRGQTRGGRGGSVARGGGRTTRGGSGSLRGRGSMRGRGLGRGGRGGQSTRGRGRPASSQRGAGRTRGGRGGRGRGGMSKKQPTKEQLDTELDKYMSKTKSVLNSQLDEYMKGSD